MPTGTPGSQGCVQAEVGRPLELGHLLLSSPWRMDGTKKTVLFSPTQGNFLAKAQVKMVEKDKVLFKCARCDIFSAVDCA